jgi:hypothetical protein
MENNPTFCQNKKIAVAISHFLKFQAQAAVNTLISSPTCPLSRFLDNLKSDFKKGLSKNYGRILWQKNILNQVSYRDTLDFG